jgi:hypothetical protein
LLTITGFTTTLLVGGLPDPVGGAGGFGGLAGALGFVVGNVWGCGVPVGG